MELRCSCGPALPLRRLEKCQSPNTPTVPATASTCTSAAVRNGSWFQEGCPDAFVRPQDRPAYVSIAVYDLLQVMCTTPGKALDHSWKMSTAICTVPPWLCKPL